MPRDPEDFLLADGCGAAGSVLTALADGRSEGVPHVAAAFAGQPGQGRKRPYDERPPASGSASASFPMLRFIAT